MEGELGGLAIAWSWWKDALFPFYCFSCGQEGAQLCQSCWESHPCELAPACCPFCHEENGEGKTCSLCAEQTFLDGCLALGFYRDPILRGLLQDWKFNSRRAAGQALKDWLKNFPLEQIFPPVDWSVTPVPLHRARQRERGFNQAEELARLVAEESGSDYLELLQRKEWTEPQARRALGERKVGDLDGAFEVINLVPPRVIICDDVLTSGATLDAAAKTLKEAGAQIVWGFTLVRADR